MSATETRLIGGGTNSKALSAPLVKDASRRIVMLVKEGATPRSCPCYTVTKQARDPVPGCALPARIARSKDIGESFGQLEATMRRP